MMLATRHTPPPPPHACWVPSVASITPTHSTSATSMIAPNYLLLIIVVLVAHCVCVRVQL